MFDFLARNFSSLFSCFSRKGPLSEDQARTFGDTVQQALLDADVPLTVAKGFVQDVSLDLVGSMPPKSVDSQEYYMKIVYDRLVAFLGGVEGVSDPLLKPGVFVMLGLQGSGKTTTIAKLAVSIHKRSPGARILFASVDFQRPAAIDQLRILAERVDCFFYQASSPDVLQAVAEILSVKDAQGYDYLFLDTAGRLHVDDRLLAELAAVVALVKAPSRLLVLDAMTGQESLNVARLFDERVGFDGAILSKADSDARGGAAFSFRYALKKPVFFVGTGEGVADLERFYPDRMASRILGLGDIATLVERANEKLKKEEDERMLRALKTGNFTLDDFLRQIDMMNKMGSLGSLLKYLPGAMQFKISPEQVAQGEFEMARFKAIIQSMTKKERLMPDLVSGSRKRRIARGAGVEVAVVTQMMQRFEEGRRLFKQLGGGKGLFR